MSLARFLSTLACLRLIAYFTSLLFLANPEARAAVSIWTGGVSSTNGNWNIAGNWNSIPNGNDNLIFATSTGLNTTNNFVSTTLNKNIVFSNTAGAFTLNGNSMRLNNGGTANGVAVQNLSTNIQTINMGVDLVLTLDMATTSNSIIFNGVIAGTNLTKSGAHTLFLNGANTFIGVLTNRAGAIRVANDSGLGTTAGGTIISNGASLELITNSAGGNLNIGAEALTLNGTGTNSAGALRNIAGDNVFGGLITLGSASEITSDSGTLFLTNTGTISGATFGLIFGGAGNVSVASIISNTTGALTKEGAGTLFLTASNRFTGGTTINAGTIALSNNGAFASNNVTFASNGTTVAALAGLLVTNNFSLAGNGTMDVGGNILTNTGIISNTGSLTKEGAGTLILGRANTYSGGTVINAGTVAISNAASFGSNTVTFASNGTTVAALASVLVTNNFTLTGNGTLDVGGNILTNSGAISGAGILTKAGAGTLILTASNNYQGGTLLNAGSLAAGNAFAFGSGAITLTNGTLLNLSNFTIANVLINNGGTLTNLGTVSGAELNGGTTTIASSNSTVAEVSGTAQVTVSGVNTTITNVTGGTVSIAGTNTTLQTVDAGTLNVAGTNTTVQTLNGGSVNVTNGTTVAVQSGSSAGTISGGGGLVKNGASTLTLSGSNTFTGGAFLNEGTLRLASTTAAGGSSITQSNGSSRLVVDTTGNVTNQMSVFYLQSLQTVTLSGAKTLNNATYDITNNTTTTESGALSGSGGITKLGTGTLVLTASNTFTGAVDVQAGLLNLNSATGFAAGSTTNVSVSSGATLLVSQNNQVNNAATVSLSGGTIRTASGVSEVFGNLSVSSASFLDFGTTSYANQNTISFGTYAPSALLTINNFDFGSTLVFKSDLSSTITNSTFFAFNNGGISSYSWNAGTSTFTITAIPEPSTYLAAAGLLAVMLWPSRRRLVRDAKKILRLRAPMRDRLAAQRHS